MHRTRNVLIHAAFALLLPLSSVATRAQDPAPTAAATVAQPAILPAADAAKIMPASVFFQGLSAPIQARNATGVRFTAHTVLLTALVDTSGYSTQVQARYQAYLITEAALLIDGNPLPPGAYGVGFIANDTFLVMDIAGNELFRAHSVRDPDLHRPTPLQILPDPPRPGTSGSTPDGPSFRSSRTRHGSSLELDAMNRVALCSLCALALCHGVPAQQTAQQTASAGAIQTRLREADTAFKAGLAAFNRNDLPAAHAAFARVVRLAPGIAQGHSAYGAVLLAEGDVAAARTELQQAHKLDPHDPSTLVNLAVATSQSRDYAAAVRLFDEAVAGGAGSLPADASLAYATALSQTGGQERAQAVLRDAVAQSPNEANLHDALGVLLARQQRLPEAVAEFQQAVTIDPRMARAHFHLGSALLAQGDAPSAVTELERAAALQPADAAYAGQLGRAYTAAGRDAEAITSLRRAATLAPHDLDTTYALALALQAGGETKEALPLLRQVAAAHPDEPAALTNLALALVQTGDARTALPLYQRALRLNDNPTLREDLGVAFLQQSDLVHAIEQFQAGLKLDPASPQLHYDLALAFKLKDDLASAISEFLQAEKLDPTLPDPPYTLGVVYMQQGEFAAAARQLEAATALKPDNGPAWEALGNVYKQSDQAEKAAAALRHAIALLPAQPSPHIVLATLLAQQGDRAGAAAERKIAADLSRVAINRQKSNFALDSGRLLLQRNQLPEALAQMQAAVAADPAYPEAHLGLAEVLERQGKTAEAAVERRSAAATVTP